MIKLYKHLKQYRVHIIFIVIFMFLYTISQLYLPTLMSDIIDKGITIDEEAMKQQIIDKVSSGEIPIGDMDMSQIPDMSKMDMTQMDMSMLEEYNIELIYKGDIPYILKLGGIMLVVALGGAICIIMGSLLASKAGVGLSRILRTKIFTKVESFSLHEFDKIGTASMITRTTNDITQVQTFTVMMLRMMIMAPLMCIGGVIMALKKDVKVTLILLIIIPVLSLVIFLIARKAVPLFKVMQKKLDKVNLVLRERLMGIRVIRAFNKEPYENKRFDVANLDLTETAIKVNKIMAALMPIVMLGFNVTTIAIVWFGGIRIDNGFMQVGDLMALIQYIMQIMFAIIMMTMMFVLLPRASASGDRINEVLEIEAEIFDKENAVQETDQKGYVEFNNITYSYHGAEEPALKNISFKAKPGETTAIIGGTGSGKSTLINLIPRFYDVDSGSVLIDGINVKDMTQESLRAKIGLVPQKVVLFTGSIEDNIKYGKDDATTEEIVHAAKVAQASEFIDNLEEGYDSQISQGGTNLSGGQKQRLSIARALVRKPEIYIFDDSFSALDFKTDAKLRMALNKETKNATILIVAQRVSTVMNSDRIIVLDNGEIVGMGKHKELIDSCEVYKEIVLSQLSEEELA